METHETALALAEEHGFSVYDALMVAAALRSAAQTLFSGNMQDGRRIADRLTIRNPFHGPTRDVAAEAH